jgi:thiol-disulfide isomerase/thioredoxin
MNSFPSKLRTVLLILLACSTLFCSSLTPLAAASPAPGAGLTTLRAMAAESVPYEEALDNSLPTLVEFYADWCTSCQAIAPTLDKLHDRYGSQLNFVMLNVDNPQWRPLLKQYRVQGVPQFLFLNRDRVVVKTLVGLVPEPVLERLFEQLVIQ